MAQRLRVFTALGEDPGLVPSTHTMWIIIAYGYSSKGSKYSLALEGTSDTRVIHIHACRQHIHKIQIKTLKNKVTL